MTLEKKIKSGHDITTLTTIVDDTVFVQKKGEWSLLLLINIAYYDMFDCTSKFESII